MDRIPNLCLLSHPETKNSLMSCRFTSIFIFLNVSWEKKKKKMLIIDLQVLVSKCSKEMGRYVRVFFVMNREKKMRVESKNT